MPQNVPAKFAPKELVFSKNWSNPKGHTLEVFQATGGYQALQKALAMTSDDIIKVVIDSKLRGRGGAGFPAGRKWSFVPKDSPKPRYVCVNADESEPGTFKDRYIMERDPHQLIEGTAIACKSINAHAAYIYVRGELGLAAVRVQQALDECYAAGILGKNVMGSGYALDIYLHRGAGAYICGEETALLESLEGKKGQPRLKPPFPAVEGLFACPTVINNVETLAAVGPIIQNGAAWWTGLSRTEAEGGTKLIGVSGHVARPGVYELPGGLTLREIIFEVAGGMRNPDRKLKAVVPGGTSCPILLPHELDTAYDFDAIKKVGSMMGTGCPAVIEEGTCIVRLLKRIERFYAHESCGQCTPCREGGDWLFKIISRIEAGQGSMADIDKIESVASKIEGHTICAFGEALSWPARSYLKKFREEFVEHVKQKRCPYGPIPVAPVALSGVVA
ncbi:MAG: NADH-quinone oxidoreductase subunit NuoF [Deltaproteobacteria bacterium]|nr:NADH-quinone oxidoreductase subunit NuoF [Deltaproteobacteria bacterium]